jgi:hypothetical protein
MKPLLLPARVILLLSGVCITHIAASQVRGMISDQSTGEKLPGATVIKLHSLQNVISNSAGEFDINAKPGDTLINVNG